MRDRDGGNSDMMNMDHFQYPQKSTFCCTGSELPKIIGKLDPRSAGYWQIFHCPTVKSSSTLKASNEIHFQLPDVT